jgi:hypothetical protein
MGEILISQQWVSPSDLEKALAEKRRTNEKLGAILLRLGHLSVMELDFILAQQTGNTVTGEADNVQQRLGDILKKSKRLSPRQLSLAVEEQKRTNEKLGEVLLRLNLLDPSELSAVLAWQDDFKSSDPLAVRLLLGEILVATKRLNRRQLVAALEEQKLTRRQLGQVLQDAGMVSKWDIRNALKIQSKMVAAGLMAMMGAMFLTGCGAPTVPHTPDFLKNSSYQAVNPRAGLGRVYDPTKATYKVASLPGGRQLMSFADGSRVIKDVPFFKQANDNTCAQAVTTVVLNYWGVKQDYQALVMEQNRLNLATHHNNIVGYIGSKGLKAKAYRGGNLGFLKSLIDQGKPPIVLLEFNQDLFQQHYVTVVGYNNLSGKIIFHDSIDGPYQQLDEDQFFAMWQSPSLANLPLFGGANYQGLIIEVGK